MKTTGLLQSSLIKDPRLSERLNWILKSKIPLVFFYSFSFREKYPKKPSNLNEHDSLTHHGRSRLHSQQSLSQISLNLTSNLEITKTTSQQSNISLSFSQGEENRAIIRLTLDEICSEFKDIYKMIENQNDEVVARAAKELFEKTEGAEFVKGYLKSFNDGTIEQVKARLELFPKLIELGLIDKWDFNTSYGECLFDLWCDVSDFPGIESNYAKIFVEMVSRGKCMFKDLYLHPSIKGHDDKDLILETYNVVLLEMQKLISTDYLVSLLLLLLAD